jgi:hypothetical protein
MVHVFLGNAEHLVADVDAFCLFEVLAETQQNLAGANSDVEVFLSTEEGVDGVSSQFQGVFRAVPRIIGALSVKAPDVHSDVNYY